MSYAGWPLQKAVFARLQSHEATAAYEATDNDEKDLPYIKIGEATSTGRYTTSSQGSEHTITTHFWAEYSDQVGEMMAAYDEAVRDGLLDLSADGFAAINIPEQELAQIMHDYDEKQEVEVRHGVMRHRFLIQKQ